MATACILPDSTRPPGLFGRPVSDSLWRASGSVDWVVGTYRLPRSTTRSFNQKWRMPSRTLREDAKKSVDVAARYQALDLAAN